MKFEQGAFVGIARGAPSKEVNATAEDRVNPESVHSAVSAGPKLLGQGYDQKSVSDERLLGPVSLTLTSTSNRFELWVSTDAQDRPHVYPIESGMRSSDSITLASGQTLGIVGNGISLILTLEEAPDKKNRVVELTRAFFGSAPENSQEFVAYTLLEGPEGGISILSGRTGAEEAVSSPTHIARSGKQIVDVEL